MKRSEAQARKARKAQQNNLAENKRKRPPLPPPTPEGFAAIAIRSRDVNRPTESKLSELKLLWRNAKDMGLLTPELRATLTECAEYAKSKGVQHA